MLASMERTMSLLMKKANEQTDESKLLVYENAIKELREIMRDFEINVIWK